MFFISKFTISIQLNSYIWEKKETQVLLIEFLSKISYNYADRKETENLEQRLQGTILLPWIVQKVVKIKGHKWNS